MVCCILDTPRPPLRPEWVVCPNPACGTSGRIGVHSRQERRYKCHVCGGTFAETVGTPLYGLKHPTWLDWENVVEGKSVDLRGRSIIKKKKTSILYDLSLAL